MEMDLGSQPVTFLFTGMVFLDRDGRYSGLEISEKVEVPMDSPYISVVFSCSYCYHF
jgi:hypothetical protein